MEDRINHQINNKIEYVNNQLTNQETIDDKDCEKFFYDSVYKSEQDENYLLNEIKKKNHQIKWYNDENIKLKELLNEKNFFIDSQKKEIEKLEASLKISISINQILENEIVTMSNQHKKIITEMEKKKVDYSNEIKSEKEKLGKTIEAVLLELNAWKKLNNNNDNSSQTEL